MGKSLIQLIHSGEGSFVATMAHIVVSFFLDIAMDDNISNAIGLFIGFVVNFYLQSDTFLKHIQYGKTLIKFIMVELFIIIVFQIGYNYLQRNKYSKWKRILAIVGERWRNTFIRILVGLLEFVFISFPLRKYFVFTKN